MEKIGIFCASSNDMESIYYEEAARLGQYIGGQKKTLVYGGNSTGLMEATARAVHEAGGQVMGVIPQIIYDRGTVSKYVDIEVPCVDLNDRKQLLADKSDIIIAMPGSVGTLDEAFTVIAANTIGYTDKRLIFWNINGFWNDLKMLFDGLRKKGVMRKEYTDVFTFVDTLDEIKKLIAE